MFVIERRRILKAKHVFMLIFIVVCHASDASEETLFAGDSFAALKMQSKVYFRDRIEAISFMVVCFAACAPLHRSSSSISLMNVACMRPFNFQDKHEDYICH